MPRLEESDSGHNLHSSRSHRYRQPLSTGCFQVESHRAPPVQPNQQKLGWRTPHRHRQDPPIHPCHQNGIRPHRQCLSHPRKLRHRNQDLRRGNASTQPRSPRNARSLELYRTPRSECELIVGHRLSPITKFGSGAGYEYENSAIYGFAHTNKGHWNLCNIPVLPATGVLNPDDFGSAFNHKNESAHPGYYQVYLDRYHINAELTSTLRTGFHRYTYRSGLHQELIVNLAKSNENVTDWKIDQAGDTAVKGFQNTRSEKVYFYAVVNHPIKAIEELKKPGSGLFVLGFGDAQGPLEFKIGLSYVSTDNAKQNLEQELAGKSFDQVKAEASETWEKLLSKIQVTGGTERQKELFYSCLYRSFLWPALRSDVNGEFLDQDKHVVKKNFRYYTLPSL